MTVSIAGINKAALLAALYNEAQTLGLGYLNYDPTPMTEEEAAALLAQPLYPGATTGRTNFDYIKGRLMKVDLGGDEVEVRWYERDNGDGVAQRIIEKLREATV